MEHSKEIVPERVPIAKKTVDKEAAQKKRNINVQAAYLHVLGDLLNSVGVVLASACIYAWPQLWYLDPICTCFFALIIVWTTRITFCQCIYMLMECTPHELDPKEIARLFSEVDGVSNIHDLHTWALSQSKFALSVHVRYVAGTCPDEIRVKIEQLARHKFHINHLCIQTEKGE